tara:strand:+ start:342 stop:764 length:423 start_codon:yes stop_codon:yes gene_type:complete
MTKNYKILAQFIKDMSSETPDVDTYMYVKDNISNYNLGININSRALKNKIVEIDTAIKFETKEKNVKKSIFEFIHTSIVHVDVKIKDKKILEKIILVDVQKDIYPNIEKTLLNLLHNSGYPSIKVEKKVDFDELYKKNFK